MAHPRLQVGQRSPGKFTLEDLSGTVPIDVSKAEATMGFFTENSIVLAIGQVFQGTGKENRVCKGFSSLNDSHLHVTRV